MPEGTLGLGGNGQTPASLSANGQTPTQGTPTAGNGQAPASNTEQQQTYSPPSAEEWRKFQAEFAEAKREAIAYRKAREEAESAKLSDLEKAAKERDKHKANADLFRAKAAALRVEIEAKNLGIVDPEVAAQLIAAKLEIDDDGAPTNAVELLKDLVKAKPYLLASPQQQQPNAQQRSSSSSGMAPTNPGRGQQGAPQGSQQQQARTEPGQMARFGTGKRLFTTGNGGG